MNPPALKSIIRIVLAGLLVTQELSAAALPAPGVPGFAFKISSRIGAVTQIYNPTGSARPDFILIQNLHQNRSVQRSIVRILKTLKHQELLPARIAVEGLTGPYDASDMQNAAESSARERAADYLLSQGEMPGALHFIVVDGAHSLFGIEDPNLYAATITMYRQSYQSRVKLLDELQLLSSGLDRLSTEKAYRGQAAFLKEDFTALEDLLALKVTSSDLQQVATRTRAAVQDLRLLLPQHFTGEVLEPVSAAIDFYALARMRDPELTQRAVNLRALDGQQTTLLIAGGFHTDGIAQRLKRAGYSFAVITPRVGAHTAVDQNLYVERMLGRHLTVEQAAAGDDWAGQPMAEAPLAENLPSIFGGALARKALPFRSLWSRGRRSVGILLLAGAALGTFVPRSSPAQESRAVNQPRPAAAASANGKPWPQVERWIANLRSADSTTRERAIDSLQPLTDPRVRSAIVDSAAVEAPQSELYGWHILSALRILATGDEARTIPLATYTLRQVQFGIFQKDKRNPSDITLARAAALAIAHVGSTHRDLVTTETIDRLVDLARSEEEGAADSVKTDAAIRAFRAIGPRVLIDYYNARLKPAFSWVPMNQADKYQTALALRGFDLIMPQVSKSRYWQWKVVHFMGRLEWAVLGFFLSIGGLMFFFSKDPVHQLKAKMGSTSIAHLDEDGRALLAKLGPDAMARMAKETEGGHMLWSHGLNRTPRLLMRLLDSPQKTERFTSMLKGIGKPSIKIFEYGVAPLQDRTDLIQSLDDLELYLAALSRIYYVDEQSPSTDLMRLLRYVIPHVKKPSDLNDRDLFLRVMREELSKVRPPTEEYYERSEDIVHEVTNSGLSSTIIPAEKGYRKVDPDSGKREDLTRAMAKLENPNFEWLSGPAKDSKSETPRGGSGGPSASGGITRSGTSSRNIPPQTPGNERGGFSPMTVAIILGGIATMVVLFSLAPAAGIAVLFAGTVVALFFALRKLVALYQAKRQERAGAEEAVALRTTLLRRMMDRLNSRRFNFPEIQFYWADHFVMEEATRRRLARVRDSGIFLLNA